MSVALKIEEMLQKKEQDKRIEKFQEQYIELLAKGVIQRKEYGLANLDVIGDKKSALQVSSASRMLAASFNE